MLQRNLQVELLFLWKKSDLRSFDSRFLPKRGMGHSGIQGNYELRLYPPRHILMLSRKNWLSGFPEIPGTVTACREDSARGLLTTQYIAPVSIKKSTVCPPPH